MKNLFKSCKQTLVFLFIICLTSPAQAMDGKHAERVIQAFGAVQLETAGFLVAQESRLPFPKDEIKKAILFAMPLVDSKTCEFLRSGYVQLGMFHDVREIPMLDIPDEVAKLSDEELYKFIQHAGAGRLGIQLQEFVISDMKSLLSEVPNC